MQSTDSKRPRAARSKQQVEKCHQGEENLLQRIHSKSKQEARER